MEEIPLISEGPLYVGQYSFFYIYLRGTFINYT